uniref:Secreted protein n=1 Tax=Mesocestoides corti TaxID=53468 RepID=A0A5K3EZ87_MESCO
LFQYGARNLPVHTQRATCSKQIENINACRWWSTIYLFEVKYCMSWCANKLLHIDFAS